MNKNHRVGSINGWKIEICTTSEEVKYEGIVVVWESEPCADQVDEAESTVYERRGRQHVA